jgi:phage gpG-like protein
MTMQKQIPNGNCQRISGNMFILSLVGDARLITQLAELERHLDDLTPVFKDIADDFRSNMDKVFASSGAFKGRSAWAPLSDQYASWKASAVGSRPILVFSGDMRNSFTRKGPGHVCLISGDGLVIGSKDPKAHYHQAGTSKMPARKIVEMTEEQRRRWSNIIKKYLFE